MKKEEIDFITHLVEHAINCKFPELCFSPITTPNFSLSHAQKPSHVFVTFVNIEIPSKKRLWQCLERLHAHLFTWSPDKPKQEEFCIRWHTPIDKKVQSKCLNLEATRSLIILKMTKFFKCSRKCFMGKLNQRSCTWF